MPDTTDVNLIVNIGGIASKWTGERSSHWVAECKIGLSPVEEGALIINYSAQFDKGNYQLTLSLNELKEAIFELEKFNSTKTN